MTAPSGRAFIGGGRATDEPLPKLILNRLVNAAIRAKATLTDVHPSAETKVRRGRALLPRPLAGLLGLALLLAIAWSLVTPPWQAPDENSHFGYVQHFAETGDLPGEPSSNIFSTEQNLAGSASNSHQVAAQLGAKMEWAESVYDGWRAAQRRLPASARADGGGPNPATSNPPLYYVIAAGAYGVGRGTDVFGRLQLVRLASALWILVTVAGAWLLAGELFGRDRLLQTVAAGVAGLAPMNSFVSGSVSPDALLVALWSLALWLGVRALKHGVTASRAAVLCAVVGLACTTKSTSYALLPAMLLVLGVGAWRARGAAPPARLSAAGAGLVALLLTLGVWVVMARILDRAAAAQVTDATQGATVNVRELVSYVWQFYLPRLGFQIDFPSIAPTVPVYDIWVKGAWASFGWLEVQFPEAVYVALAGLSALAMALAVASLWRGRRLVDRVTVAFLALVAVALLAGLHWTEYQEINGGAVNFNQGRYLLPLVALAGVVVAQAVRVVRPAWRGAAAAGVLGGLLVLNVFSLGLTLDRFHA